MALKQTTLSLASATLGNGARIATIHGQGRITIPNYLYIDGAGYYYNSAVFDPDNNHVWLNHFNNTTLKRYLISSGAVDLTGASPGSFPMGMFRDPTANLLYCAQYSGKRAKEYNLSGALTADLDISALFGASSPGQIIRVPGVSGLAWARAFTNGGNETDTPIKEFSLTTGLATGRTIAPPAGGQIWSLFATTGFIWMMVNGLTIQKYDEPTLTLQTSWNLGGNTSYGNGDPGLAGSVLLNRFLCVIVDSAGRPIALRANGTIDRYQTGGGGTLGGAAVDFDRRIHYGPNKWLNKGGSAIFYQGEYSNSCAIAISDNGNWLAFPSIADDNVTLGSMTIVPWGTYTALWTQVFTGAVSLKGIILPGALRMDRGPSYDFRATVVEYRLNGGSYIVVEPNLIWAAPIAISAGDTLDVRASLSTQGQPPGEAPYIGGDDGGGITLVYDDLLLANRPRKGFSRGLEP